MPGSGLWSRIKNARIVQVLLVYLAVSWVLLQVVGELRDALQLPEWIGPVSFILLVIGLLMVVATAWVQSHPLTERREAAEEVPSSWEIDVGEIRDSLTKGEMPHLTWARALLGGVFVFSILFGIAGLYVVIKDRGESFAPPEAIASGDAVPGIAILPFSIRGEGLELWEEGMVDALSTNLDGAGGFRTIAAQTVLARWREAAPENGRPDLPTALGVAAATGARYAVTGSVLSTGANLRVTSDVYDVPGGNVLGHGQVEGAPDSIFSLVDRLSVEVLRSLVTDADLEASALGLARVTSESLTALKAYLEGEALYRSGDVEAAIPAYERAIEADSTFAMASYRLRQAYGWTQFIGSDLSSEAADRALRYADRLPPRQATLVRAGHALARGDLSGIDLLQEAVVRHPDDAEAWYLLGDIYYHQGPRRLVDIAEVERAFGRAVELAPQFAPYQIHWVDLAGIHRPDSARVADRLAAFRSVATGTEVEQRRVAFEMMFGDSATQRRALEEADVSVELYSSLSATGLRSPRFSRQMAAWRRKVYDELPPNDQPGFGVFQLLQVLTWGRGQIEEHLALLDAPTVSDGAVACVLYEIRAQGLSVPEARLRETVERVTDEDGDCALRAKGAYAAELGRWEEHRAVIDAFRSRAADVRSDTTRIAERRETAARFPEATARMLEGFALWQRGDLEEAVRVLEEARPYAPWLGRWWLAQLYLELDRPAEAKRYLESVRGDRAMVHYHLGRVSERLGDLDDAREAFETFVIAFEEADPELQPLVEEARQALARLADVPGAARATPSTSDPDR